MSFGFLFNLADNAVFLALVHILLGVLGVDDVAYLLLVALAEPKTGLNFSYHFVKLVQVDDFFSVAGRVPAIDDDGEEHIYQNQAEKDRAQEHHKHVEVMGSVPETFILPKITEEVHVVVAENLHEADLLLFIIIIRMGVVIGEHPAEKENEDEKTEFP